VNRALVPIPLIGLVLLREQNSDNLKAEELLAYELGYRVKPRPNLNFDLTAYYFDYDNLIEFTTGPLLVPGPPPAAGVLTFTNDNALKGEVFGFELAGQWQPFSVWRLGGSYSYSEIHLTPILPNVFDPRPFNSEGDIDAEDEPNHIFNLRSYLNLPYNLELDTFLYYVSRNSARGIPAYTRLDLRLGWIPTKNLEFSLVSQNLQDNAHPELNELLEASSETQRSFYFKATFKY